MSTVSTLQDDLNKACWLISFVLICIGVIGIVQHLLLGLSARFMSRPGNVRVKARERRARTNATISISMIFTYLFRVFSLVIVSLLVFGSPIYIPRMLKLIMQAIAEYVSIDCHIVSVIGDYFNFPLHWPFVLVHIVLSTELGFQVWSRYFSMLKSYQEQHLESTSQTRESDQNPSRGSHDKTQGRDQATLVDQSNSNEPSSQDVDAPSPQHQSRYQQGPAGNPSTTARTKDPTAPPTSSSATSRPRRSRQHLEVPSNDGLATVPTDGLSTPSPKSSASTPPSHSYRLRDRSPVLLKPYTVEDEAYKQAKHLGKREDSPAVPRSTIKKPATATVSPNATPDAPSATASFSNNTAHRIRNLRPRSERQIHPYQAEREDYKRSMRKGKQGDTWAVPPEKTLKKEKKQHQAPNGEALTGYDSGIDVDSHDDSPDNGSTVHPEHATSSSGMNEGLADHDLGVTRDFTWREGQPIVFNDTRKPRDHTWNKSMPIVFGGTAGAGGGSSCGMVEEVTWRDVSPFMSGAL